MSLLWPFSLMLGMLFQSGNPSLFPDGTFTEKERLKIEKKAADIQGRIGVYRDASIRMQKSLQRAVSQKDFGSVPDQLKLWGDLLSGSIQDIDAHVNPKKKKSKALIKFEIHVRKSIIDLRDYKIQAPADQQDAFNDSIAMAESIRKRMVDILFPSDTESQ
jgi:hypothetical protein